MDIERAGSQPSGKGSADWFTGTVRIDPLFQANDPARAAGAAVTFEPDARTAWHTHPLGQTLIVTTGAGLAQCWGGPIEEIRPGDVVWFPPGEKHWHGASATTAMTHIAIQEQLDGKVVDWMEKVSDDQYHAKPSAPRLGQHRASRSEESRPCQEPSFAGTFGPPRDPGHRRYLRDVIAIVDVRFAGLTLRATLSAIVLVAACGGRDAGSSTGAWQFKVDTTRSQTDGSVRETSRLRTIGKEHPEGAVGASAVIFSFDCVGDNAISTIMTDQSLRQGSVETRLTLDADSPRRIPGFAGTTSSGGQVVLTIPQDSMLGLLSGHQRAVIEYADGAGSSRTIAEFPIAGLEKHRGPFLAACAKIGAR